MDDARPLLKRLVAFLEAYNQKRHPVVRDVERHEKVWRWGDLPSSPSVKKAPFEDPTDNGNPSADEDEFVLKAARPTIPQAPAPPEGLAIWLVSGWEDPRRDASWTQERDDPDLGHQALEQPDEARLRHWKVARDAWAERVRDDYVALQLFQWLWDVNATLDREGERYELVLGDGILAWDMGGAPASHPLLIQRLQVEFDPAIPSFTVVEADRPPELYAGLLRSLGADPAVVGRLLETADADRPHPLGDAVTADYLAKAASELHPRGQFHGFAPVPAVQSFPQIVRAPVLFLRVRALGYEAAIQAIKEDLERGGQIPDSLLALVGVHPPLGDEADAVDPYEQGDEAEDVLLTKEANREQLEIARRLTRYGAVLVQGPPGTGKTHTIANLIGHLLANGKTVLVTSHTTKALRVLREKVVPELQPLCVSVLEGDTAGNAQLKDAVTEIGRRLSSSSEDQLRREAEQIRLRRLGTLEAISRARGLLLDAVRSEYSAIVLNGLEISPTEAAKRVHAGMGEHSWIPGKVTPGAVLPLAGAEVRLLYKSNDVLPESDLRELRQPLPDVAELTSPVDFASDVTERRALEAIAGYRPDLWGNAPRTDADLDDLVLAAKNAYSGLSDTPAWYLEALNASLRGADELRPWSLLREALVACLLAAKESRLAAQTYVAALPDALPVGDAERVLDQIIRHLQAGKSLGRIALLRHREWKQLIERSTVLGQRPVAVGHFVALHKLVGPARAWKSLVPRWEVLMTPLGETMPSQGTAPDEPRLGQLSEDMGEALDGLPAKIEAVARQAAEVGLDLERMLPARASDANAWRAAAAIAKDELPRIIEGEAARLRLAEMGRQGREAAALLSHYAGHADASRPVGQLIKAIKSEDPDAYLLAYERLAALSARKTAAAQRDDLLSRLSPVAHEWSEAIRLREPPHDAHIPPGDPVLAWEWKQLVQELDQRSAFAASPLIAEIGRLRDQLREQTTGLIDRLAWAAQCRKTTPAARQALGGYVELVKRIGKGTGRRAPRLREAARQQMVTARAAVPVWIAPLARVAEAFDPRSQRFDVVIIDEASQSDVLGLIAWYLGQQVVVVGDDQQVTPIAPGERVDDMTAMIDAYLRGIPNHELYDGQASIYELASTAFRGVVRLREHFRCIPEIISFSNSLSYSGEILPLRDPSSAIVRPAVVPYRVNVAPTSERNINEKEARHVASLLVACLEQPEYSGLTFGALSLLGREQAIRIEQILRNFVSPVEYQARRLLCGIPPHFQGDERDVVFLSMVDAPPQSPPLSLRGDPGERFKKRYNVAASRARDQLWVVHSLDRRRDLKTDDLRWRLLEWAADPSATGRQLAQALRKAESPFEKEVIERLVGAGYRIKPQHPVGGYRIDIVVEGEGARLAVECDGSAGHSTDEQIRTDLDRQALLERMGWRFHRIRGSEFYRDRDGATQRLFAKLTDVGISPARADDQPVEPVDSELLERVKLRAAQLREQWWNGSSEETSGPASAPDVEPDGTPERHKPAGSARAGEERPRAANGSAGRENRQDTRQFDRSRQRSGPPPAPVVPTQKALAKGTVVDLDSVTSAEAAAEYFRNRGLRVVDRRAKGGALWVYGAKNELGLEMKALRQRNLKFSWSDKRGGWWLGK